MLTADSESGNALSFKMINDAISSGEIDPCLSLLTVIPDIVHVAKFLKGSFSNWWLTDGKDRMNIGQIHTLR